MNFMSLLKDIDKKTKEYYMIKDKLKTLYMEIRELKTQICIFEKDFSSKYEELLLNKFK